MKESNNQKPDILALRRMPGLVEDRFLSSFTGSLNKDDKPYAAERILELATGRDGLIVTPTDAINKELIDALPDSVRIIATFSVGFEHIDLEAARARGITVTNTPGVLTEATADLALLCLLGAARRAREGMEEIRTGTWSGWRPTHLTGIELTGKVLGFVGMGRIGRAVAARARAFGMEIHYHNRSRLSPDEEQGSTYHGNLESLLPVSRFLTLHCPLTAETRHLINAGTLEKLPTGAVLINTARGPVVDDEAVIAALKSGRLAAAGLDVFDGEPALNPGYLDCPTAFLLPHLGSATVEARNAMGFKALDNLDAFFAGKEPPDRVV